MTFAINMIEWRRILPEEAAVATNKTSIKIELSEEERCVLEQVARGLAVAHRDVIRARTILLVAEGASLSAIARQVGRQRRIVQRERLKAPNFLDLADLESKILTFINEWNQGAEPFNWTKKSFEKTLAKVDAALKAVHVTFVRSEGLLSTREELLAAC